MTNFLHRLSLRGTYLGRPGPFGFGKRLPFRRFAGVAMPEGGVPFGIGLLESIDVLLAHAEPRRGLPGGHPARQALLITPST